MLQQESVLSGLKSLPAAPLVLARVLSLADDPKAGGKELIEAIEVDPGVTANLLRVCNSPAFAARRELSSLDDAVMRVGLRTVIQFVTMQQMQPILNGACDGYGLAPGDLWRHSVATALACRLLAQRVGHAQVSLAFTGGLLHDVGKIALDVFLKPAYQEVRQRVEQGFTFKEAEAEVLGVEHAALGARIAEQWSFPAALAAMIRYHHEPHEATSFQDLCALVHLGDALAHWLGIGLGRPGLANRFESSAVRRFGLQPEDLDRILIDLVEKMEQTERALAGV